MGIRMALALFCVSFYVGVNAANAQPKPNSVPVCTVANLAKCAGENPGNLGFVYDGANSSDCTIGGGSMRVLCMKDTALGFVAVNSSACADAGSSICAVLSDENGDGNWVDDWRRVINQLTYSDGVPVEMTARPFVEIWAPPAGTYNMTAGTSESLSLVRYCHDESGPADGSSAVLDCTGNSATDYMPELRLRGEWDKVIWNCTYGVGSVTGGGTGWAKCFQFGDAAADGYNYSGIVRVKMDSSLRVVANSTGNYTDKILGVAGVWFDGVGGVLRLKHEPKGTEAAFQIVRLGQLVGPGEDSGFVTDLFIDYPVVDSNWSGSDIFALAGDLTNVTVHGESATHAALGYWNTSTFSHTPDDCTHGTAWTYSTCRNIVYAQDYSTLGTQTSIIGSGNRFMGTVGGIKIGTRSTCADPFTLANVFSGTAFCTASNSYCVRGGMNMFCDEPNLSVFDGRAVQTASTDQDRNSVFYAQGFGPTLMTSRVAYDTNDLTENPIAQCHTSIGIVEAVRAVNKSLHLHSYASDPGTGQCLKMDGSGVAACGSSTTKWYPGKRGTILSLQGIVGVAVPSTTSCDFYVKVNGVDPVLTSTECTNGTTLYGNKNRYLRWGGIADYIHTDATDLPLRALGDRATQPIMFRLADHTSYIEVVVSDPKTATGCASGSGCTCDLGVDGFDGTLSFLPDLSGEYN